MKKTLVLIGVFLTTLCFVFPAVGQITNAGFENWSNGNPVGWTTTNLGAAAGVNPVTQVTTAHSGTYALKGAIVPYILAGYTWWAWIQGGYPYTTRSANLTGWYQMVPAAGAKDSLTIASYLYKSKTVIAAGAMTVTTSSTWKQFIMPLYYISNAVPDSAWTWIMLANASGNTLGTVGSYFLLDDLAYSGTATAVDESAGVPNNFALDQNYPNPFNPSTTIRFSVAQPGHVSLKVYNVLGVEVASLVNQQKDAGTFTVNWNAAGMPSGMYLYRMSVTSDKGQIFEQSKKLVLMK